MSSSSKKSTRTSVGRGGEAQVTEDSTSAFAASNSARLEQDGVVAGAARSGKPAYVAALWKMSVNHS